MLTADDFREAVLSLHGASEGAHMGHPDFRAAGRIFASLSANEETGTVKLTPEEQAALMDEHPRTFTPAAGAWGRQGWTVVHLTTAQEAPVRGALLLAWQGIVNRPRKVKARTASAKSPTRPSPRRRG